MTDIRHPDYEPLDIVAIECEARALRAQVVANAARAAYAWVRARLSGAPAGRTA